MSTPREHRIGPWLVALGAGLWGTESAWRIPLGKLFSSDVMVFWEHVLMAVCVLPFVLPRLRELRGVRWQTLAWLIFSGLAGSALGAVLFTQALKTGNPTVINVVLNIQPILSTSAACLLFGDRLGRGFAPWAGLAVLAGMVLVGLTPWTPHELDLGIAYALACALCWGLSTVAGRGVMVDMSLPLASGLRVLIGLVAMTALLAAEGQLNGAALWPAAAQAQSFEAKKLLVLLATVSGVVPLFVYFKGLELTRASTAGYFEMIQTVVAVVITWWWFDNPLTWYQAVAAVVLLAAVAMVQRVQEQTAIPVAPGLPGAKALA